jgi:hypothetical protein
MKNDGLRDRITMDWTGELTLLDEAAEQVIFGRCVPRARVSSRPSVFFFFSFLPFASFLPVQLRRKYNDWNQLDWTDRLDRCLDTAPPDLDTELAWESVGGSGIVLDSWVLGSAVLLGIFPSLCTAEFGAEGYVDVLRGKTGRRKYNKKLSA